ncbi:MAG: hypothetical protein EOO23_07150 [Comamonadaceae bacterium]|nr:MAG: hypothetical protein EOO23_07150 [Comamonadaceae bacterium]
MRIYRLTWAFIYLALLVGAAQAATVTASTGDVQFVRGERSMPAVTGTVLLEGDAVLTSTGSGTVLTFEDGGRLLVRAQSQLQILELPQAARPTMRGKTIRIMRGSLRYVSGKAIYRGRVRFETRGVSVGIRGTDIELSFSEESPLASGTYLKVNRGQAFLEAIDGTTVELEPGQVAYGALPGLRARGPGGPAVPAARRIDDAPPGVFERSGSLDEFLN